MYKVIDSNHILRVGDTLIIPVFDGNQDYQEYLTWVAKGNTPDPADVAVVDVKAQRKAAYLSESDQLFMEWKYDETDETHAYWMDKVRDIKLRYPLPSG